MHDMTTVDTYGTLIEPATVRLERLLPAAIERVWDYLTVDDLRRRWLAAGEMTLELDAPFELVWRNDELTDPPGQRPEGMSTEHRMPSRITELDPPRRLGFTWTDGAEVTMELEPRGRDTLLTITHRRLPDRPQLVGVSAGWHNHLDLLDARLRGTTPAPFWDGWVTLRAAYEARIPR
jgi:uncharacterized protein YndB with AHSA1/START domain